MNTKAPLFILLLASLCVAAAAQTPAASQPDRATLIFLHINDSHGQIDGTQRSGGYARLATTVERVRVQATQPDSAGQTAARVFLLHCGDISSRGDALTSRTSAAANIAILNRLRFDAWVPGNGEYYLPIDTLQARVEEAKFPTLAANVKVKLTGRQFARQSVIMQAGPVKVALFALCCVRTQVPGCGVTQDDWTETAAGLVPKLRKQADLVVAMTHIGAGDDAALIGKVAGIDMLLGGHSHTILKNGRLVRDPTGRQVLICQAGDYLSHLGKVTVRMKRADEGWRVESAKAELLELDDTVPRDEGMVKFIEELKAANLAAPKRSAAE